MRRLEWRERMGVLRRRKALAWSMLLSGKNKGTRCILNCIWRNAVLADCCESTLKWFEQIA